MTLRQLRRELRRLMLAAEREWEKSGDAAEADLWDKIAASLEILVDQLPGRESEVLR